MDLLEKKPNQYIRLFSDCVPVKGALKSAIYDLTAEELVFFPSEYFDLISDIEGKKNEDLNDFILQTTEPEKYYDIIEFLFAYEFAMLTEKPERFPKIEDVWEIPNRIQNAIIDFDTELHDMDKIAHELDVLGCRYVQMRFFSTSISFLDLKQSIEKFMHTSVQGIELFLCYNPALKDADYIRLLVDIPIISNLIIHSSPKNNTVSIEEHSVLLSQKSIEYITQKIDSESHCGVINLKNLSIPRTAVFFENKHYNGCLNRKISVDKNGWIKNCPSMSQNYGSIKSDSLINTINDDEFTSWWNINKDQIKTCSDCELRYICSDCRVYTEDNSIKNTKPLKCGYNPYTGEWEE